MPTSTSASITFQNKDGINAVMHVPTAPTMAALRSFAYAIAYYTNAKIVEISFSEAEEITDIPGSTEETQDLGTMALLSMRGEMGKTLNKDLAIPAPKKDLVEVVAGAGQGLLVKRIKGQEISDLYGEMVGEEFTFLRGRLL